MHKYDELYRLLVDSHVVLNRAVRESERIGLKKFTKDVRDLHAGIVELANSVMTKIESGHIAELLDPVRKLPPTLQRQANAIAPQPVVYPMLIPVISERSESSDDARPDAASDCGTAE